MSTPLHPNDLARFRAEYAYEASRAAVLRNPIIDAKLTAEATVIHSRLFGSEYDVRYADGTIGWVTRPGGFTHSGTYAAHDSALLACHRTGWPMPTHTQVGV